MCLAFVFCSQFSNNACVFSCLRNCLLKGRRVAVPALMTASCGKLPVLRWQRGGKEGKKVACRAGWRLRVSREQQGSRCVAGP